MVTIAASAAGLRPPTNTRVPAVIEARPRRTTRRGLAPGANLGMPTAAASSATDSGSSRTPVCSADSSSTTDRNSGTVKNTPAWMKNWKKNIVRPPASWELRSMAGRTSGSPPRSLRCPSQRKNP